MKVEKRDFHGKTALEEISWDLLTDALTRSDAEERHAWSEALTKSADYYEARPPERLYRFGAHEVTARAMASACRDLADAAVRMDDAAVFAKHLEDHYRLFRSVGADSDGSVLVTAYYEPLLEGSKTPSDRYRYPIYRYPDEMIRADLGAWRDAWRGKTITGRMDPEASGNRLIPYHDRQAIDGHDALVGRDLELIWVEDPITLFFLHIQGSGRVRLQDGTLLRVGYHGSNGHRYRSIGKILIQEGEISREQLSLQTIRQWLKDHPKERQRLFFENPSYVFFRPLQDGPLGNIQVVLTPGHSIATDHRLFPKGAPSMIQTELPLFDEVGQHHPGGWRSVTRLAVNQDTGGAIRGAGRVDLFLGFGDRAERSAGIMKQSGTLYFIAPVNGKDQTASVE